MVEQGSLFARFAISTWPSGEPITRTEACWLGVGLSGRRPSYGVPVDVLQMVFAQEIVRRRLGLGRSIILVADSNARAVGFSRGELGRVQARLRWTLEAVVAQFGFPVEVIAASSLAAEAEEHLFAARAEAPNPYVALQMAQTELMRRRGAGVKIGWAMPGFDNDERHFDTQHDRVFGQPLVYVYTRGGHSLNPERPRCCPYVCENREDRLLLEPGENLERKLGRAGGPRNPLVRSYRKLVARLARAHRELVGPNRPRRPEARLQAIIDQLPSRISEERQTA